MVKGRVATSRLVVGLCTLTMLIVVASFLVAGAVVEDWLIALLAEPQGRLALGAIIFLLLAGDIVLPVPSSVAATAAGAALGPLGGTLVAGGGLAAGALAGLIGARWLGRERVAAALGSAEFVRLQSMLGRLGPLAVLLCRPVPVLAETSVLVAGACGATTRAMALPIGVGSLATGGVYAVLGSVAHDRASLALVLLASCLVPAAGWLLFRPKDRPRRGLPSD